ncbi:hypothetical protein [Sphingomonas sp. TREG-RG-20F-R18-01]|uniref:hypothetical protein n=1 Tax=Sphingomonas sp. TREG-RG-20F-R18-01 TaxID=2914982 RepID=UPI001F56725B|nr:hypothetical protein [Sphingomonas sp. TREG-RG-20F-R18-01]
MTPRPDLNDPAERAAYQRELRMVARPVRWLGVALAIIAAMLALVRARYAPQIPMILPLFLLGIAALHMIAAIVIRMKYHQARMKPQE